MTGVSKLKTVLRDGQKKRVKKMEKIKRESLGFSIAFSVLKLFNKVWLLVEAGT